MWIFNNASAARGIVPLPLVTPYASRAEGHAAAALICRIVVEAKQSGSAMPGPVYACAMTSEWAATNR